MLKSLFYKILLFSLLVLWAMLSDASIVRMTAQFGTAPAGDIYIEMFDVPVGNRTAAPLTVANFLNYIDDGNGDRRYDGTFIHRSVSGFVIQGGGYKYDPAAGAFSTTTAPHIPEDVPVVNEFDASRSNLRGTIAMAKLPTGPDTATSEWFFNLADNSGNLDFQNGGFTVFGQVLGNGMSVVDSIAALPITNQGGVFSALPVTGFTASPVTSDNLITITPVISPYPPPLFVTPAPLDFGQIAPNLVPLTQQQVTIVNTGSGAVTLGAIGNLDPLAAPFAIVAGVDNCSNQTLASFASCTFAISFDPQVLGALLQDSVDVAYNDGSPSSLTLAVSGTGAFATPTLEITSGSPVDFGPVALADFSEQQITLRNAGIGSLQLGAINVSGANAADFSIESDAPLGCKTSALALSETCTLTVRLAGNTLGSKGATLNISASPGSQLAQVALGGNVIASQADIVLPIGGTFDVGDTRSDLVKTTPISLGNQGTEDLIFAGFNIIGADASQFGITAAGCQRLAPNQSCQETITFTPSGTGPKTATLEIQTNDPDTPVASLVLNATSSLDNDGIPDAVELAGPNGGDFNQDGTPDAQQENLASFPDTNGAYVALESSVGTRLANVVAITNPGPGGSTPTISEGLLTFPQGFYSYTVENVPVGGQATVTLYLSAGTTVNHYFKYGRFPLEKPASSFPRHWYPFDFQSQTQTGGEFLSDRVILHFVDGGLGDDDQTPDGVIVDPGGPAQIVVGNSSSAGGCTVTMSADSKVYVDWWLVFIFAGVMLRMGVQSSDRTQGKRGRLDAPETPLAVKCKVIRNSVG